ncbi:hypothetical protein MYE70_10365 [Marinobacter alexandrii]|uniref:hypothetical protein n=1 Tax=Marinobacter alexandrii TaxID=2570351 RepID=UPI001FFF1DA9|nr:hypothetical protein [Marinobacter alexandrii]MCK2149469.1 hypothetical protein [Marinobacter alexandrii]
MARAAGRTITPKIIGRKEVNEVAVPKEMLSMAQERCRPMMRDLIDGQPVTNVLIKAYMQGFIDCYEAGKVNPPEQGGE